MKGEQGDYLIVYMKAQYGTSRVPLIHRGFNADHDQASLLMGMLSDGIVVVYTIRDVVIAGLHRPIKGAIAQREEFTRAPTWWSLEGFSS